MVDSHFLVCLNELGFLGFCLGVQKEAVRFLASSPDVYISRPAWFSEVQIVLGGRFLARTDRALQLCG